MVVDASALLIHGRVERLDGAVSLLATLAAHLADKTAGRSGTSLSELDAALDRIDADSLS
jgi:hypothetical protein